MGDRIVWGGVGCVVVVMSSGGSGWEDGGGCGQQDEPAVGHPEGEHDGDLGDEAGEQRQTEARHPAEHHVSRKPRTVVRHAPHRADL